MAKIAVELDQQITSEVSEGYGTISIRVVVVTPKPPKGKETPAPVVIKSEFDEEAEAEEDDDDSSGPLGAYLEKKTYGKWCCVFLVNGQRHEGLDNAFISRDLEFKFLRDRTMVIVDLDGLTEDAMSEVMQGSRQGLFQGRVYLAIRNRLIQTLKTNPALKRLQMEAEKQALDMKAGDEAVKNRLNQLIEGHHMAAATDGPGDALGAGAQFEGGHLGDGLRDQSVVVLGGNGTAAELPVLTTLPLMNSIRLYAGENKEVTIVSDPHEVWSTLQDFKASVTSDDENLTLAVKQTKDRATVTISFPATHYGEDEFPVIGELQAFARFKNRPELRALKLPVIVTKKPAPPEPIELLDVPTFLRVRSRQPVKLIPNTTTHVRMQWNGKHTLLRGSKPKWKFTARCTTLGTFPKIGFGYTNDGNLTFVLYPPHGLLLGLSLDFEVVAIGPDDMKLTASFRGVITEPSAKPTPPTPPEPSLIQGTAPPIVGQRRPPYELKYINKDDWENPQRPCFQGGGVWTENDAGCFLEPSPTQPLLLLVVNEDMALLKTFREHMLKKKPPLDPKTISDRTNRYISYVAFHLYQMYGERKRLEGMKTNAPDDLVPQPANEKDTRAEINRVGTTVMKVMELGIR
ncbi:MAG: hypothetical protein K2X38_24225 [Gemmataceae bacterium]|nr:hypothetical protein [Gemmataceae bacterium]